MPKTKTSAKPKKTLSTPTKTAPKPTAAAEQSGSKSNQILALLRRKQGASLEELQTASGWQPHSVRGYLSGTVKKRLGLPLSSSKSKDGIRRYAIATA